LEQLRLKKFGIFGMTFVVLHVLFHVVECLIIPTALVALGGRVTQEDAAAVSKSALVVPVDEAEPAANTSTLLVDFHQSLQMFGLEL